jgi:hypothetical protein
MRGLHYIDRGDFYPVSPCSIDDVVEMMRHEEAFERRCEDLQALMEEIPQMARIV